MSASGQCGHGTVDTMAVDEEEEHKNTYCFWTQRVAALVVTTTTMSMTVHTTPDVLVLVMVTL